MLHDYSRRFLEDVELSVIVTIKMRVLRMVKVAVSKSLVLEERAL